MYTVPTYGGAPPLSMGQDPGLSGHVSYGGAPPLSMGQDPGLSGISDNIEDARAYLRSQWERFVRLSPTIIDMQHRAAVAAYDATARGDTETAAQARESIERLGALNIKHGKALDVMETYRDAVGLGSYHTGLGALPVAAVVAITALAVSVAWFFRALNAEGRILAGLIEGGDMTPAEAIELRRAAGSGPAQILGGLGDIARYALFAGLAFMAWQVWQTRPKPRRAKRNPPLVVFDVNPPEDGEVFGEEVYEMTYRHAEDGGNWVHEFGPGVEMIADPDGSVRLSHSDGRQVWEEF